MKHFLCIEHGNLVFTGDYPTTATLLASYWSDPVNQVGTYVGTQFGTNGTTCLLRHHTTLQTLPLTHFYAWYIHNIGYIYYRLPLIGMSEGGDPGGHGRGRGRGDAGEAAPAPTVGLPLQLKQPNFNWEGNVYENYKTFSERATILLGGPYAKYDDPSKISAFLSWTGDKGFQLYKNIDWERAGLSKDKWEDVVKAFGNEFKPCQTVMQSWYQLGNLYSSHCKDQTEFMTRIKDLATEGGFTNQEEIIKFLFLIHNNNTKVREYLIDKADPTKSSYDFLVLAKTIESQSQTESMSRKLLEKVGTTQVAAVQRNRSKTPFKPKDRSNPRGPSSSPGKQCGKCGFRHPPRKCPAYGKVCNACKGRNHFWKVCKSKSGKSKPQGNPRYRTSRREQYEVGTEHSPYYQSDFEFQEDCIQIEFSKGTINNSTNSTQSNIMFDEVTNTQALGDLTLSNKAGKTQLTRFKLDSGAGANLLPIGTYYKLFNKEDRDLEASRDPRVSLVAANKSRIKQLGTVRLRVHVGEFERVCKFYVVPNYVKPIFGLPDLTRMQIVRFSMPIVSQWMDNETSIDEASPLTSGLTKDEVLEKFKEVFTGLGRLKVEPVKIHLTKDAKPVRRPCRRVPIAIRGKFKDELDSLCKQKVLTKLDKNEVTEWLNSFVNVDKEDTTLRVCLDPSGLNPYIIRPVFNSYTLDEISYMLRDAKVFTVCDANKGFFQVPLAEESKKLTAMLTPEGVYIHNVLAMGLSLASDVFEMIIKDMIKGLSGVINIADDLLIFGNTIEEHDRNLLAVLERCKEIGLTLNPRKFKFKCKMVPFFGNVVSDQGILPDPKKVQSIKNWPSPKSPKELQSFLGAVNYLSKFIPELSSLRSPLQGLIKKDSEYLWTGTHEQAFQKLKNAVCESTLLSYYDKSKPIFIEVDASGQGLGAVLLQGNVSNEELKQASQTDGKYLKFRNKLKPIAFASKSLSEAEQRYSNIERELLGVVWAIQHFNHYTFANKINIISDHKPLQPLFSGKALTSCSPRTARLLLKVIDRDVMFFYQQGPSMHLADPLSRLSTHNIEDGNKEEVQGLKVNICDITSVKNVTLDQFKEHTGMDEDFKLLKMYVMHGWPSAQQDCVEQLRSYYTFKEEISFIDGLLFKGNRVIVPKALRNKTLEVLHRSHMGIVKTQERARTSFYWPGLNKAIKDICQSCETCLQYAARQDKQEIGLVPDCSESWEALATDIFEFQGKYFLIIACRFSSYMVVREMDGQTAEETIKKFSSVFAELGLPKTIHCDRGTNYTSTQFQNFCQSLNIKVTYSSAEHHQSNYAERGVQTIKQFMRKTKEWQMALLEYLMTPIRHQGSHSSPLQLMKKRTIRGILPVRQQGTCSNDYDRKVLRRQEQAKYQSGSSYKDLAMGSSVLYYDHDKGQWVPGVLVEKIHDRSYVIISQKGRKITRNRIDIKPYPGKVQVQFELPKVPLTSPTIMSKQASSSSHRPFHHNNTKTTSTPTSITSSMKSSISPQTQTLSTHHDRKSCSLDQRHPISKRAEAPLPTSIQLDSKTAKSASYKGKMADIAVKAPSEMPKQTRSGRRVLRPKRYED